MVVLRQEWQAQRQKRQHEVSQRQDHVHHRLGVIRQRRQNQAQQVRHELRNFRESILKSNEVRLQKSALLKAELLQSRFELQQQTQNFLASTREQRQRRAHQVAQQLDDYVRAIQQQTKQFLTLTAIERLLMAQQLRQELESFHISLSQSVASLRQELQANLQSLKEATQAKLAEHHRQRMLMNAQTTQRLFNFMQQLRTEVNTYLSQLDAMGEDRALQVQQTLSQSRAQTLGEVKALFQRLSVFRAQLHQYRVNLHDTVWGPDAPVTPSPVNGSRAAVKPPVVSPSSSNGNAATQKGTKVSSNSAPGNPSTGKKDATLIEKDVYNYIHKANGARLAEIESAVATNRVQAVDALRSLIKKGLIVQRDRMYLTRKEVSL